ncbi:MAG TPA: AAA family ATPase [Chloroflexota bacterium]|nr:AAA family ATPase [Chloroflexota bacterium]
MAADPAGPAAAPLALEAEADAVRVRLAAVEGALREVVVGQAAVVEQVLAALLAGGHVLLEGVPGLGKTLLVRTLGQVAGLDFGRVQFTPDLMPGDVTGSEMFDRESGGLRFAPGPIFTNLLLADEINRATPRTQSALLEAMQERTVTAGGQTHRLPDPFFVLATQNPLEMEGTYPLPEAQLDRFLFKVLVPYPTDAELAAIGERTTGAGLASPPQVLERAELAAGIALVRHVVVAPHVLDYAVRLVGATHPDRSPLPEVRRFVRYGASPRGLQALLLGAKVAAVRAGRWNVAFADLDRVALPALRHRLILQFEATAEGITADYLVGRLLEALRRE